MVMEVLLVGLSFISGALPFSVWVGQSIAKTDIRRIGDGNPGATNVLKAGGLKAGLIVLILDVFKGALPTAIAYQLLNTDGVIMFLVAIAPSLGHAYSPFLKWQGGKALAVSLGVWIGLSFHEIPLVALALLLLWFAILSTDAWSVIFMVAGVWLYIALVNPVQLWLAVCTAQFILILWKHRSGLKVRPAFRSWIVGTTHNLS
jgi:acyl phosphate:glycerol-3-phosphate acyltransferase